PAEMRIAARADRLDVEPHVAAHVADDVGEPFEQAEADRARFDREIDGPLRQIAVDEAERQRAGDREPDARRLIEAGVDLEDLSLRREARLELLVADALDAAALDRRRAARLRIVARAADRDVGVQHAAVAGRPL